MSDADHGIETIKRNIEDLRDSIASLREYMHSTDIQVVRLKENLQYINKELDEITRRLNSTNGRKEETKQPRDYTFNAILIERLLWVAVALGLYFLGGNPIPV